MLRTVRRVADLLLNRGVGGERERGKHLRAHERLILALRGQLIRSESIADGERCYRFECRCEEELYRARTMLEKEPGTIRWIGNDLRPGDVFYDIGANVGIYTIYAAARLGSSGHVYAFEPHAPSFQSLMRNIALNGLRDRTSALSCALHSKDRFLDFNYRTLSAGTSDSQLGARRTAKQKPFKPKAIELKQGIRVDTLLRRQVIRPPNLVKLDVDGNELPVLKGMSALLQSSDAPRAIQLETNPRFPETARFLEDCGYALVERHYTLYQQRRLDSGATPEQAGYNAIYRKG